MKRRCRRGTEGASQVVLTRVSQLNEFCVICLVLSFILQLHLSDEDEEKLFKSSFFLFCTEGENLASLNTESSRSTLIQERITLCSSAG